MTSTDSPSGVSVVIPCRNEGANLGPTVDSVLAHAGGTPVQVIVVDDGSSDGAPLALARENHSGVQVVQAGGIGAAGARNYGASLAHGRHIVFLDAQCEVEDDWLAGIVEPFEADEQVVLATPAIVDVPDGGEPLAAVTGRHWQSTSLPWEMAHWNAVNTGDEVPITMGACQAVDASRFRDLGGFLADILPFGGEDAEICLRVWRAGYKCVGVPGVTVRHQPKDEHPDAPPGPELWANLLKVSVLHWPPVMLADMWVRVADAWADWPDLFDEVWERCHTPTVLDIRETFDLELPRTNAEYFERFPLIGTTGE